MDRYKDSLLWKKTLGSTHSNPKIQEEINKLKKSYMDIREKSSYLAGEISRFMPNYTVHDIEHIDALWEAADIMLPAEYDFNPVEGYILGVAFLIHDLGMGLAAYLKGRVELENSSIWRDIAATEFYKTYGRKIERSDWNNLDTTIKLVADENALRKLHAEQASKLPFIEWEFEGKREQLIDDIILKDAFGEAIGQVAYSHWWNIEKVNKEFSNKYLGAVGTHPNEWTVDLIKLACVLRIADAIQIDDRRAPAFLMKLRRPQDLSKYHWTFQNKLYKPIIKYDQLLFTSKSSFSIEEVDAWWTCYDTLKMIDREIKTVNALLLETNHKKLNASGVRGLSSIKSLSEYISVDGWRPVDTRIRVGNVARLVSNLGGSQLYGNNLLVPMRELIQNAGDAIRARKVLEDDEDYKGNIIISFHEDNDKKILEIQDNGVGMSENVLLGPFLDFGQSFWNTELMYEELPELSSKGYTSAGQYGIGFFSVFMWSKEITVITRRFDAAREDTLVLEFKDGVNSRPLLRKAEKSEYIKLGGTKIRIRTDKNIFEQLIHSERIEESIDSIIAKACPCLDCNLYIDDGEKRLVEKENDWLSIPPIDLIKRLSGPHHYAKLSQEYRDLIEQMADNMEILKKDDTIYGRAMIFERSILRNHLNGCVTLGGFNSTALSGILGVLIGKSIRASRDAAIPIIDHMTLFKWANSQHQKVVSMNLESELQLNIAATICALGGHPSQLFIAENREGYLTYNDIYNLAKKSSENEFIIIQDAAVNNERFDKKSIEFNDNVIWCDVGYPCVLQNQVHFTPWPFDSFKEMITAGIKEMVVDAIMKAWEINRDNAENHIIKSTDEISYSSIVGTVDGQNYEMRISAKIQK